MAAAIAFYGLISLVPLGVLAISVFGRLLGSSAAVERQVIFLLGSVLPPTDSGIEQAIRQFTQPGGRWFIEIVSILGLLWAGSRLFHTLEDVLTRVWSGHGRGRSLFSRNLVALAATFAAGVIFLAIMLTTAAAAALASRPAAIGYFPALAWWRVILRHLAPIAGAWLMFSLTYRFLPQETGTWRHAAIAAAGAAVLWEISRIAFAALVTRSAGHGRLYGSLAGTVVLTLWIYLTASIMLLGAELAVVLQQRTQLRGEAAKCSGSAC